MPAFGFMSFLLHVIDGATMFCSFKITNSTVVLLEAILTLNKLAFLDIKFD